MNKRDRKVQTDRVTGLQWSQNCQNQLPQARLIWSPRRPVASDGSGRSRGTSESAGRCPGLSPWVPAQPAVSLGPLSLGHPWLPLGAKYGGLASPGSIWTFVLLLYLSRSLRSHLCLVRRSSNSSSSLKPYRSLLPPYLAPPSLE